MPTRSRPIHGGKATFQIKQPFQASFDVTRDRIVTDGIELSHGHIWPVPKADRGYTNSGGDVQITSHQYEPLVWSGHASVGEGTSNEYAYDGVIWPISLNDVNWPGISALTDNEVRLLGTHFINITIPTKPRANVAQFIGELRDLPKIPLTNFPKVVNRGATLADRLASMRESARYFKNLQKHVGDEYLNVEFGWKPFVQDVGKAVKSAKTMSQKIQQLDRDSGKVVHRKFDAGTTRTITGGGTATNLSADPSYADYFMVQDSSRVLTRIDYEERHIWFSAAYTYYLPPPSKDFGTNFSRGEEISNILFGTRINPTVMWQLAPWSWLLDWHANIGEVLQNFDAFTDDNLLCNYAYIMVHSKAVREYTYTGKFQHGGALNTSFRLITETKQRTGADPYGFATKPSNYTGRQVAILAALGLTRGPHG